MIGRWFESPNAFGCKWSGHAPSPDRGCFTKFGSAAGLSFAIASGALASGNDPSLLQTPGAAPTTVLSDSARARLRLVLSHYRADRLSADDARALRSELSGAGLERSPALAEEMTRAGFSLKRIEALDGSSKTAPSDPYQDLPSGRRLPPSQ